MVSLLNQKDFRAVQNLPFCYLCGKDFANHDFTDKDHVPPESAFAKRDREPLLLKTHVACNHRHSATDEKIGQLIALKHGKVSSNPQNRRLQVVHSGAKARGRAPPERERTRRGPRSTSTNDAHASGASRKQRE